MAQISAVDKALGNPLILQHILKNVGTSDLLNNCRLVAKTNWFDLSTEVLSRRKDLQISFTHLKDGSDKKNRKIEESSISQDHWKRPGFFTDSTDSPLPLKYITSYIKHSMKLRICHFRFAEGFIEDDEDFALFINVYGQHIVCLEMDLLTQKGYNCVVPTFGRILMQLPNLESLRVGKVSLGWNSFDRLFSASNGCVFKMLTSIQIGTDVNSNLNFLNDLKAAAPNLRVFQTYSLPYSRADVAQLLGRKNEDGIYDGLNIEINENSIKLFEEMVRRRPKFRSITLNLKSIEEISGPIQAQNQLLSRARSVLQKILNASRTTLKKLENFDQLELLPNFKMPPLTEVNSIKIKIVNEFLTAEQKDQNYEDLGCINNLNFTETFPALNDVELEGPSMGSMEIAGAKKLSSLDPTNLQLNWTSSTTVIRLKINPECSNLISAQLIQQLGKTFSMVERLEIGYLPNFPELAPKIWDYFPKLSDFSVNMIQLSDNISPLPLVQGSLRIHIDQSHPQSEFGAAGPAVELERNFEINQYFVPTVPDWASQLKLESEKDMTNESFPIEKFDCPLKPPPVTSLKFLGRKDNKVANKLPVNYLASLQLQWTPTRSKASLEMMSYRLNFSPTMIRQLGQTFSMVKMLDLSFVDNFIEMAPAIWTNFPRLIRFSATIDVDKSCTLSMVQKSFGIHPNPKTAMRVEKRSRKAAIFDLTGLKTVSLKFCYGTWSSFISPQSLANIKPDLQKVLPNSTITVV